MNAEHPDVALDNCTGSCGSLVVQLVVDDAVPTAAIVAAKTAIAANPASVQITLVDTAGATVTLNPTAVVFQDVTTTTTATTTTTTTVTTTSLAEGSVQQQVTACQGDADGHFFFLDRHSDSRCPAGTAMSAWKVAPCGNNEVKVEFSCAASVLLSAEEERQTVRPFQTTLVARPTCPHDISLPGRPVPGRPLLCRLDS